MHVALSGSNFWFQKLPNAFYFTTYWSCEVSLHFLLLCSGTYERDIIIDHTCNFGRSMDTHICPSNLAAQLSHVTMTQSGTIKFYTHILGLNRLFISNTMTWNSHDKFQECIWHVLPVYKILNISNHSISHIPKSWWIRIFSSPFQRKTNENTQIPRSTFLNIKYLWQVSPYSYCLDVLLQNFPLWRQ